MDSLHLERQRSEKMVLSAPISPHQVRTLNQVILAVSVLSILGAGWIILSFYLFKQVRTFRHQLILGLAVSDFWMAMNFLAACATNLSGNILSAPPQEKFCNFNGFMTQLFVVQTDYWVLMIAICTYLILANHKHMSAWIQDHKVILWAIPWGFSALWATLGLVITGYGDIGAWCWFTSDKVRLLVNFIPRWLIIIIVLGLYMHLYRIIYKAHNRFMSFQDETSPQNLEAHSVSPETESVSSTHRIGRPSISMNISSKDMHMDVEEHSGSATPGRTHARQPSPVLKKMARQMMSYPLVYMLIWTIPTTIRIYQSVTGNSAPFGIGTVDKACIVIQGFADAIIYGVNETSLAVWRERFRSGPTIVGIPVHNNIKIQHEIKVERSTRAPRLDSF